MQELEQLKKLVNNGEIDTDVKFALLKLYLKAIENNDEQTKKKLRKLIQRIIEMNRINKIL